MNEPISQPEVDHWPGAIQSFKLVKPYVKTRIWDFISVIGIGIALSLIIEIILSGLIKQSLPRTIVNDIASLIIGAFLQAAIIKMYYDVLLAKDFTLSSALNYGFKRLIKMIGILIIVNVLIVVSLVLLVIPFFFVLPRLYLAPYYLIKNDSTLNQALAASWHSTHHNLKPVWGVLVLNIGIALLFLTIIGIPLAIYWGVINTASFAYLTLYLSQPKKKKKHSKLASAKVK